MIEYKIELTEIEKRNIETLSKDCCLFFETATVLYSRGYDTPEKVREFLSSGKSNFLEPTLLKGVKEAAERIEQAKRDGETVLVYGDYDADGICATTVMYYALKEFGIDAVCAVPERSDGYGLSEKLIDKLLDEYLFGLIITVDCGISCYNEVEYLKSLGVDVIVTDHHELPEKLPECIVVNCKIPSEYANTSLCGTGVAYKLSRVLIGDKADELLDFVAIATIADSMPLTGENRDIVFEGVKYIKSGRAHLSINELIATSNLKEVTSTGLAFTIAPRINAAGRMGDAASALRLMKSSDACEIETLAVKLNAYNRERQEECEKLYIAAREKLVKYAYNKKLIVLEDDSWNGGLVGIIAAKLVEEFSRPVILFVNTDGKLHGSARSVYNVNIFEAIFSCRKYLTDFGGHAQAAGVSLNIESFDDFKRDIEKFIDEKYDFSCFNISKQVEFEITKPFSIELAKELQLLEPFGMCNKKPQFSVKSTSGAMPIKPMSPHISIRTEYIDLLYFNGSAMLEQLNSGTEKEIIFEPNVSIFNREESLKGYVKGVEFLVTPTEKNNLFCFRNSLLTALNENDDFVYLSSEMTKKVITECLVDNFGTIFAVYNAEHLAQYSELESLSRALFTTQNRNLVNNVVLGLSGNTVDGYRRIIYLDRPLGAVHNISGIKETFIDRSLTAFDYSSLDTSKKAFADIFRRLKPENGKNRFIADDSVGIADRYDLGYGKQQIVFVVEVFAELGFFAFNSGALCYNADVRAPLTSSRIYSEVEKLK